MPPRRRAIKKAASPYTPPLMTGGDLRLLRERAGLSQSELARRIAYSPSHVCKLEHDRAAFTQPLVQSLLATLAAALNERSTLMALRQQLLSNTA